MKNSNLIKTILISHLIAFQTYGQTIRQHNTHLKHEPTSTINSIQHAGLLALQAALNDQVIEQNKNYNIGEFTTQVQSSPIPFSAGVGRLFSTDEEASAFTTASVMNILGQIYLDFPDLHKNSIMRKVPHSLKIGVDSFQRYANRHAFNFYPPYTTKNGITVRRPVNMKVLPFWNGFTNIPNDADTTSVTNAALLLEAKINAKDYKLSETTISLFEKYRDSNRKAHYYNKRYDQKNTGAFLTWLYDENDPEMPRFFFASAEKGERIPFNRNDVDCIVNANVIKMFALSQLDDPSQVSGVTETCNMLNKIIEKDREYSCGIYYPNTYNLSFILSLLEKSNQSRKNSGKQQVQCLSENSKEALINKILDQQYTDGYWTNINNLHSDRTISTSFALYTLQTLSNHLNLTTVQQSTIKEAQTLGVKYLLSQTQINNDGSISWKGENFFTATALVRSLVMWKSKGYTNGIVAAALLNYAAQHHDMSIEDILNYTPEHSNRLKTEPQIYDQFDK